MTDSNEGAHDRGSSPSADDTTRPQRAGEAGTSRFGMEDGDNTDVPATGLDPDQQSGGSDETPTASESDEDAHARVEDEAAKLGDFA